MNKRFIKLVFINFFIFTTFIISLEIISGYFVSLTTNKKSRSNLKHLIISYLEKSKNNNQTNRIEKIISIRSKGNKNIYPSYLYDPKVHKLNNLNFWFSHPKNAEIIFCDEGSGLIKFKTNKLGLREVSLQNLNEPIDILILGDSYVEGACVNKPFDISSQLAKLNKQNVLNLGRSGSGPLFQLSLLKEILKYKNLGELTFSEDTKLIWVIFTGNDLIDLSYEKISILQRYIKDYDINYFKELELSNIEFNKFFEKVFNDPKNNRNIGRIGDSLVPKSIAEENALIDFEKVFEEIKNISLKNNLDLNIISLSNHKFKSKQIMKNTENLMQKLCNKFDVQCNTVNLSLINQSNRGHLDEKGYKKLSEIINEFSF
tara:strand:- start:303 stop:1421 length:1119 start_codon:yes stop_codon:yes gene_type:complete